VLVGVHVQMIFSAMSGARQAKLREFEFASIAEREQRLIKACRLGDFRFHTIRRQGTLDFLIKIRYLGLGKIQFYD
jgi:hypothetical protein